MKKGPFKERLFTEKLTSFEEFSAGIADTVSAFGRYLPARLEGFEMDQTKVDYSGIATKLEEVSHRLSSEELTAIALAQLFYGQIESYYDRLYAIDQKKAPKCDSKVKPFFVKETWKLVGIFMIEYNKKKKRKLSLRRKQYTNCSGYEFLLRVYESDTNELWLAREFNQYMKIRK